MPDITMCAGGDCPLKENCWRFRAPPEPRWQSWFSAVPFDHETGTCLSFAELTLGERKQLGSGEKPAG